MTGKSYLTSPQKCTMSTAMQRALNHFQNTVDLMLAA